MRKLIKNSLLIAMIAMMLAGILGCGNTASSPSQTASATATQTAKPVNLTISAAASLKESIEEIKQLYTKEHSNVTLTYNFGSSGSLQQQIEQGAPADIFISASTKQMTALKDKGLIIDETNKNLLENKVVLIVPKDSYLVKDFKNLADSKVKKVALGEPSSVPVGQYSEEILSYLKILDKVKSKSVYGKDVKEVLTWVETGNVDAGIVYETDAKVSDKVKIVATAADETHKPVVYPAAVIKSSKNADAAKDFLNYLSGTEAKAVFEKYGFKVN